MSSNAYKQVANVILDKACNLSESEREALKGLLDGFSSDQLQISFPSYSITVNYDLSVEQLIQASMFSWFNDSVVSRHFPSSEKGVAEILVFLVNFNRDISSKDVIRELDRQGFRPATLKELLALSIAHPDLQRNNCIVAFGSIWCDSGGGVFVPYLYGGESGRDLNLGGWSGVWYSHWQFAAVRR